MVANHDRASTRGDRAGGSANELGGSADVEPGHAAVGTMHLAKGLEFRAVPNCRRYSESGGSPLDATRSFSNNLSYRGEPLIPLRQYGAGRLEPTIDVRPVADGYLRGSGRHNVNPPEAAAIVEEITRLCADDAYHPA